MTPSFRFEIKSAYTNNLNPLLIKQMDGYEHLRYWKLQSEWMLVSNLHDPGGKENLYIPIPNKLFLQETINESMS